MAEEPYAYVVEDLEDDLLIEIGCPKKTLCFLTLFFVACFIAFIIWLIYTYSL